MFLYVVYIWSVVSPRSQFCLQSCPAQALDGIVWTGEGNGISFLDASVGRS